MRPARSPLTRYDSKTSGCETVLRPQIGVKPRLPQLIGVGTPQVEAGLRPGLDEPAVDVVIAMAGVAESSNQRLTHFVVAGADARADRGEKVAGVGAEFVHHRCYRGRRDPGARAAPAGMNGGGGAANRINDHDRYAIGDHHAENQAGLVGNNCVAIRADVSRIRRDLPFPEYSDHVAMYLLDAHQAVRRRAQRCGGLPPAFGIR
jgi:hypothetical protein